MENVEKTLVGQAAPEEIEAWKREYGRVFSTTADGHVAYFRKPNRKELSYVLSLRDKPLEMTETLMRQCFVGGSRIFIDDVEYMLGCDALIERLVNMKMAEVGEL